MTRMFETREITKLLDVLIGKTEAVGETDEDERRLDNLKTLIDVTNWCLDGLQFAMASGYGRAEYSMAEISYTAQCALDEYGRWIADVLDEQIADSKTEPQTGTKTQNSNLTFEIDKPQTVIMVKDHGRKQALEMIDLYHELKTENSSEKPNNSKEMDYLRFMDERKMDEKIAKRFTEDLQDWKDRMWAEAIVTEPTTEDCSTVPTCSKMEQVEPQTDCETCRYAGECDWEPWQECPYAPKDEPQTERSNDAD